MPRLYRFALKRVGYREDAAEEAVQATLVRAIEKMDTFRGESTLVTWLCAACRNLIEDDRSRAWRRYETEAVGDDADFRATTEVRASAEAAGPEAVLLSDENARRIHEILDGLPPPYGDVLEWKYIANESVNEISRRLGVSLKAAESTLTRARVAFRRAFDGEST